MNALNTQMRAEITHAVRESGETARVVVLTGAGRAFCLGQDLGAGADPTDIDLECFLKDEYMPMLDAISHLPGSNNRRRKRPCSRGWSLSGSCG